MVKWNEYVEEKEKERIDSNGMVPEGVYDVTVANVVRRSKYNNPDSVYTMVTFDPIDEGQVPPIFVYSGYNSGDTKKDNFVHYKAVGLTNEIYAAADVDPSEWDLAEDDPMFDGLSRIIGASLKVIVELNQKTGRMDTIPLVPPER